MIKLKNTNFVRNVNKMFWKKNMIIIKNGICRNGFNKKKILVIIGNLKKKKKINYLKIIK